MLIGFVRSVVFVFCRFIVLVCGWGLFVVVVVSHRIFWVPPWNCRQFVVALVLLPLMYRRFSSVMGLCELWMVLSLFASFLIGRWCHYFRWWKCCRWSYGFYSLCVYVSICWVDGAVCVLSVFHHRHLFVFVCLLMGLIWDWVVEDLWPFWCGSISKPERVC